MTSLKTAWGFFADFLKSGAQSAIPVAMTSGLPASDRTNDISNYRLDVLFGVKTLDGRLATRVSGT